MTQPFVSGLLQQADSLLSQAGPGRPKQANLRRAVSASYYAVFHQIVHEVSVFVLTVSDSKGPLGARLRRTVHHNSIKLASSWLVPGGSPHESLRHCLYLPPDFETLSVPPDLQRVCKRVIELQRDRHRADYDLSKPFTLAEAKRLVDEAKETVNLLENLQASSAKSVFLLGCMLGSSLTKNQ